MSNPLHLFGVAVLAALSASCVDRVCRCEYVACAPQNPGLLTFDASNPETVFTNPVYNTPPMWEPPAGWQTTTRNFITLEYRGR